MYSRIHKIIFHTIYSMPIGRYSVMTKTKDGSMISRIPLPRRLWLNKYDQFKIDVSELFGGKNMLDREYLKLSIYNTITILTALHMGLNIEKFPEMIEYYEERYGKPYKRRKDLKRVRDEIKRLTSKYKELDVKSQDDTEHDIEDVIVGVESVLGRHIDRSITLFQFKYEYDHAKKLTTPKKTS